jgi:large subunit ribosomal protein L15
MRLNELVPTAGAKKAKKRVGRGQATGVGKTCGRGHKGQKSRGKGKVKPGFEGGQMPLIRRIPKSGFNSRLARITAEIRLSEINKIDADVIDLNALRAANLISHDIKRAKIFASGEINRAVTVRGIRVTKGAAEAITAAGGKVEQAVEAAS